MPGRLDGEKNIKGLVYFLLRRALPARTQLWVSFGTERGVSTRGGPGSQSQSARGSPSPASPGAPGMCRPPPARTPCPAWPPSPAPWGPAPCCSRGLGRNVSGGPDHCPPRPLPQHPGRGSQLQYPHSPGGLSGLSLPLTPDCPHWAACGLGLARHSETPFPASVSFD